jgi:hypothetical protein
MKKRQHLSTRILSLFAVAALCWLGIIVSANAADHLDPPERVALGDSADIGDVYAWASGDTLNIVVTFGGPLAPSADQEGAYDADVLYGIHIDNTGNNESNVDIFARFAQNDLGDWGVQVIGLPGTSGTLVGAVEETLSDGPSQIFSGLKDDPFFFDLAGFQETLGSGTLAFDSTRDFFAGQNITTIVFQMPLEAASGLGSNLSIWAATARIGGDS